MAELDQNNFVSLVNVAPHLTYKERAAAVRDSQDYTGKPINLLEIFDWFKYQSKYLQVLQHTDNYEKGMTQEVACKVLNGSWPYFFFC